LTTRPSSTRKNSAAPPTWQVIDLVRGACVIAVMGVHYYSNVPFDSPWKAWLWGRFCVNGFYGVFLFFMVSGFLITHVLARDAGGLFKPDLPRFYLRRIGRIWPLFLLCLAWGIAVFFLAPPASALYRQFFTPGGNHDGWFWFCASTFLFNWLLVFRPDWNYSVPWMILWSLAIEEQFYLLYPWALGKIRNTRNFRVVLALVVLAGLAWRSYFYFHRGSNDFVESYASPAKFDLIACGIALYLAFRRYGPSLLRKKKTAVLLCLAGALVLLSAYFGTRENDPLQEIFVPEVLAGGLFLFLMGGLSLSFWESPWLKALAYPGRYCYGCYLLHPLVLFISRPLLGSLGLLGGFALLVLLTTLVASLSYRFFEWPANRLIRGAWDRWRSRGAARA